MLALVAEAECDFVAMHMRGTPADMQDDPRYDDVVAEVSEFLLERLAAAEKAGVARERLWADPGIGFGKTAAHNLELLVRLPELVGAMGDVPVMVGTSRKSFIGGPVEEREEGTLATVVWALERGVSMVRVHQVGPARQAVRLLAALESSWS
jgi:dihydropteroate synthase